MWNQLKIAVVAYRQLRRATKPYTIDSKHLMVEQLRVMLVIIPDLKSADDILSDDQ